MGLPGFYFHWLTQSGIKVVHKEEVNGRVSSVSVDANGLLHPLAQKYFSYGPNKDEAFARLHRGQNLSALTTLFLTGIQQELTNIVAKYEPTDAFVIAVDGVAPQAKIAQQLGLQVPRDLSIVGSDNMNPGGYWAPPLTTAEQDRAALGQVAVERLIHRIENHTQSPPQIISIPLKLIERESTGPAPTVSN